MVSLQSGRRQFLKSSLLAAVSAVHCSRRRPPNVVFIHTDDQRHDALGCAGNPLIETPAIDSLAAGGVRFQNAFVTTSICCPSRACCFTGRYGSLNGVTSVPGAPLREGQTTFVSSLKEAGYRAGYVGKWHLAGPATPEEAGFDFASYFVSNGPQWDRKVTEQGEPQTASGFIEDYIAGQALQFLDQAAPGPFLLHYSTQVPHMDHEFQWRPKAETRERYAAINPPLPPSYNDDLTGKPGYLRDSRSIHQARRYGYDDPANVISHTRDYYAAITDMDAALGRLFGALDSAGLRDNTYFILMGDNGWLLGEHRFTSKVLAYEESIRVPMIVAGPDIQPGQVRDDIVINADVAPTILDFAGLPQPNNLNGRSLYSLLSGAQEDWRRSFYYEVTEPSLGVQPQRAIRNNRWKYILTDTSQVAPEPSFEELYDLTADPAELNNLAAHSDHEAVKRDLAGELDQSRRAVAAQQPV